ncbi:Universal stress protein family protein [Enhygromyxa salina]|uniref:Universal stress protein family protein n=1 Tax=Enhygromyxa salina TaxID=215803 RepID=A0A2S9YGT5_9BACT|nr:universal stress protein [Enhygromyxa salina]PRQ04325.1 Universal stress protein family protein [Enhygromyxa salina]
MSTQDKSMRWVVGLDLRPHCHGAINFAVWLRQHYRGGQLKIDGLHVVENALFELPESPPRAELLGGAKKAAHAAVLTRDATEAFSTIDVVAGEQVTDMLAAAGKLEATTGLILGRRAAAEDRALIRLGKVARRLLRRLEVPTFVVPPDLELKHIGPGPIVCAVDLDERGVELARFGEQLAARLGRDARLVHVIDSSDPIGLQYLPEGTWNVLHARTPDDGQAALAAWREAAGLSARALLAQGQIVPKLVSAARELDACMILCGSRRLSLAERLWISSVGSSLAAAAHLPVGVVPSQSESD